MGNEEARMSKLTSPLLILLGLLAGPAWAEDPKPAAEKPENRVLRHELPKQARWTRAKGRPRRNFPRAVRASGEQ